MVGAHGRVDVRSRLGREVLAWVEAGGPVLKTAVKISEEPEMEITRPVFNDVEEGWAWSDARHSRLLPLTADVLWDRVIGSLTR